MGYFPMQMNNTSGVCAVLRDAIHTAEQSAKPGGITGAGAPKRQLVRKAMPGAGIAAARERNAASSRYSAAGSDAGYS